MQPRFIQLAIGARRLVSRGPVASAVAGNTKRLTGRRQVGSTLSQFSFRLAFAIDLAYVGIGALGGAAVGRAVTAPALLPPPDVAACVSSELPLR
jgi:hypothetical protein